MLVLPNCRKVAEQLSENIDEPVTGFKGLMLKLHLKMCGLCRRYGEQIKLSSETVDCLNTKEADEKSLPSKELKEKALSDYKKVYGQSDTDKND